MKLFYHVFYFLSIALVFASYYNDSFSNLLIIGNQDEITKYLNDLEHKRIVCTNVDLEITIKNLNNILIKINDLYFENEIIQTREYKYEHQQIVINIIRFIIQHNNGPDDVYVILSLIYKQLSVMFFTTNLTVLSHMNDLLLKIVNQLQKCPGYKVNLLKPLFNKIVFENLFITHSPYTEIFGYTPICDFGSRAKIRSLSLYNFAKYGYLDIHIPFRECLNVNYVELTHLQRLIFDIRITFYIEKIEIKLLSDFSLNLLHLMLFFCKIDKAFMLIISQPEHFIMIAIFDEILDSRELPVFLKIWNEIQKSRPTHQICIKFLNSMKKNEYIRRKWSRETINNTIILMQSGFSDLIYYILTSNNETSIIFKKLGDLHYHLLININILLMIRDYLHLTNEEYKNLIYGPCKITNIHTFSSYVENVLLPFTTDNLFNNACLNGVYNLVNVYFQNDLTNLYIERREDIHVLKDFSTLLYLVVELMVYKSEDLIFVEIQLKTEALVGYLKNTFSEDELYVKRIEIMLWIIKKAVANKELLKDADNFKFSIESSNEIILSILHETLIEYEHEFVSLSIFKEENYTNMIESIIYDIFPDEVGSIYLSIKREKIFEETLDYYNKWDANQYRIQNIELKIKFKDEDGEYGVGLLKIWALLLNDIFLSKEKKLFEMIDEKDQLLSPFVCLNPSKSRLNYFGFIGWFIAISLNQSLLSNLRFPYYIYRMILGISFSAKKEERKDIKENLKIRKEYLNTNELMFVITGFDENDKYHDIELCHDGKQKIVNTSNFQSYSDLIFEYSTEKGIKKQISAIKKEFDRFINPNKRPKDEMEFFNSLCGNNIIDFKDWKKYTIYESKEVERYLSVKYFWNYVFSLSDDERKHLLYLITGSRLTPVGGFKHLNPRFQIIMANNKPSKNIPVAFTCNNTFILSAVSTQEEMDHNMKTFTEICTISGITLG
ncbi:E3 ubiquitin-protein ligase UPL2 [Astathelohania contejeani]|uniref:HECT-type E3 ubiquitin transferase n=1 Tax=Astathelohania contejeani TaxID=164912 RepID=A0ABQ7I1Q2_9MICR|nr:E3 ubiquitin-protein ligase UPL2 [Thelohania contejeani]